MKHARDDYARIQDPAGLIPDDEPVFLIRGQDQAAIPALLAWIEAHIEAGGDQELVRLTREQILRMAEWQRERAQKTADP